MLDSVSHNPSVLPVFWVSESQRCTSWGLIPVSPEAPLVSWHWRPEVMMEVGGPLTDHLIRLQFTLQVPWVTWPAVTRPPLPVMWHSPPLEETVVGRTRCWWERCPSLEGVNEAKGVSWVLFLVVFLGPLQGAHRLLHTVVQDVLHLRRRRRRTFSQLHLFHNNDKVTFYFRTVGLQQGKMSSESWGLLQYGPDTAKRFTVYTVNKQHHILQRRSTYLGWFSNCSSSAKSTFLCNRPDFKQLPTNVFKQL